MADKVVRIQYRLEDLKSWTDKDLANAFSENTYPSLEQIKKELGRNEVKKEEQKKAK